MNKLSESEAKRNISHLKQLQEIRDYKIKQERQRQEEQERKRKDISISINELKEIFLNLFSGKDQNGKEINAQRRGYLFEEFLKKLFLNEGIEVTEPFKIVGEQIDGSIKYDGEHYIIEAKWHDKWSASDSLYQFAAKVEGKMYGRGVFISVNGFSPDSVQALTTGKALRTILVDGLGVGDVGNVVLRDRRHLSEDGLIVVVITLDARNKEVIAGPDIISRGFVYVKENNDLMEDCKSVVQKVLDECYTKNIYDWSTLKHNIRETLKKFLYQEIKRNPMILPVIMEV